MDTDLSLVNHISGIEDSDFSVYLPLQRGGEMRDQDTVYRHSKGIVARETGDEYVLVPVTNNIADMHSVYTLNPTAGFIWRLIDGKRSVRDLVSELEAEFDVDHETAVSDIETFLEDLKDYLIIEK